jgi:hypothetical protein
MLTQDLLARASTQLDCLPLILEAAPDRLTGRAPSSRWSAHDNLAHLARYQEIFLTERCRRILGEDRPRLDRYRAEQDPEWPAWQQMATVQMVERLKATRGELVQRLGRLSDAEWSRVGTHPVFGDWELRGWVQLFLVHEAHHLYLALVRSRE